MLYNPKKKKKKITVHCSTMVEFESNAAIFKDLQANTTLTKPGTDSL